MCHLSVLLLQVNAAEVGDEPLGEFFHVAGLLIPLYAPRAWEVMEYGADGASLATAAPVADCFQVAYYCVRNSMLHPRCGCVGREDGVTGVLRAAQCWCLWQAVSAAH